jgi:hypothetical protein
MTFPETRLELHVHREGAEGRWSCAVVNDGQRELLRAGSADMIAELVAEQLERLVAAAIEQHQHQRRFAPSCR